MEPTETTVPECAQCGTRSREGGMSEHGFLCLRCAYRQHLHDLRRDGVDDEDL